MFGMFNMNAQDFGPDGKPVGNQQQVSSNIAGMNIDMQAKGFDKDGKPIPGQKQEASMNFMGMDINMQCEGFDKDGKPIPGQKQSANMNMGMPNMQAFGGMLGNFANNGNFGRF